MRWTLVVGEDGILEFPPDLLEQTGWTEGTVLDWEVRGESIYLREYEESELDDF